MYLSTFQLLYYYSSSSPREASLGDVRFSALDGLGQRVVYEHVLFLRLHEVVALPPDVLEEGEDVDVAAGLDLPHHGVQDDVAARATDTSAGKEGNVVKILYYGSTY